LHSRCINKIDKRTAALIKLNNDEKQNALFKIFVQNRHSINELSRRPSLIPTSDDDKRHPLVYCFNAANHQAQKFHSYL